MLAGDASVPADLIYDRAFIRDYGLGFIHPGTRSVRARLAAGYLIEAQSAFELAACIGVDPQNLTRTISDYNRFADTGVDSGTTLGPALVFGWRVAMTAAMRGAANPAER